MSSSTCSLSARWVCSPGAPPAPSAPLAGVSPGPLLAGDLVLLSQGVLGDQPPLAGSAGVTSARGCSALCTPGRPSLELRR